LEVNEVKQRLIAVYGGTRLIPKEAEFITKLAFSILGIPNVKLVTGGFRYKQREDPEIKSADEAVLEGAEQFSKTHEIPLETRLETWLPETDKRQEIVDRFKKGEVKWLTGSDRVRRLSLVEKVDGILTFKGKNETGLVLDAALANNKLTIPLPFSGGDSKDFWDEYRDYILSSLEVSEQFAQNLEEINLQEITQLEIDELIENLVEVLRQGLKREEESVSRIETLKNLVRINKRRLDKLRERKALFGINTPVEIEIEIEDIEKEIEELGREIHNLAI
jgi:hypothetical protein